MMVKFGLSDHVILLGLVKLLFLIPILKFQGGDLDKDSQAEEHKLLDYSCH